MYKEMASYEMLQALGMDGQKWAQAFIEFNTANPSIATDEGTMIGWFANAIMAGYDTAMRRKEEKLIDAEP